MLSCTRKIKPSSKQHVAVYQNKPETFGFFPGAEFHPSRRTPIPIEEMNAEQLALKRKSTAVKYLRKILMNKVRQNFKDLKANAWTYYNQREQKKLKSKLQLFKVLCMIQDKMKGEKFQAMSKIKERGKQ